MVDLSKLIFHSNYNALKNSSIQRGQIALPASYGNSGYSGTLDFTLTEAANFVKTFSLATDYGQYFNDAYLDGNYHDFWREINANNDYLLFGTSSVFGGPAIYSFKLSIYISGTLVRVTLSIQGTGTAGEVVTISHPTGLIPINFIDYTLAN